MRKYFSTYVESGKPLIPDKDIIRKKNYRSISLMNIDAKFPNKILNQIQRYKKDIKSCPNLVYDRNTSWFCI